MHRLGIARMGLIRSKNSTKPDGEPLVLNGPAAAEFARRMAEVESQRDPKRLKFLDDCLKSFNETKKKLAG